MEEKKELKQDIAAEEYKKELEQKTVTEDKLHKNIITKMNKRFLLLILALIVLSIGLYFVLRETGVINKYVYEEIDNLAEREGVCFDNLLFSYMIVVYRGGQREERWLCIMNNGDVYAFEWYGESSWNRYEYEWGDEEELIPIGYNDANWAKMENVIYLGRFSDSVTSHLNSYVENFDVNGEYYYLDPPRDEPQGGGQQGGDDMEESDMEEVEEVEWISYEVVLYWHTQPKDWFDKQETIEWCRMNPTWWGGYKEEFLQRSLDENAIAAIKLFESSGFYDRWVKMCLNGY